MKKWSTSTYTTPNAANGTQKSLTLLELAYRGGHSGVLVDTRLRQLEQEEGETLSQSNNNKQPQVNSGDHTTPYGTFSLKM